MSTFKAIVNIVSGLMDQGIGKASLIISKTHKLIKEVGTSKNITKDHIEIIAESSPDFLALREKNKRDKEQNASIFSKRN